MKLLWSSLVGLGVGMILGYFVILPLVKTHTLTLSIPQVAILSSSIGIALVILAIVLEHQKQGDKK